MPLLPKSNMCAMNQVRAIPKSLLEVPFIFGRYGYAQNPVSSRSTTALTLASTTGPCQVSWSAMPMSKWEAIVNETILSRIDKKVSRIYL